MRKTFDVVSGLLRPSREDTDATPTAIGLPAEWSCWFTINDPSFVEFLDPRIEHVPLFGFALDGDEQPDQAAYEMSLRLGPQRLDLLVAANGTRSHTTELHPSLISSSSVESELLRIARDRTAPSTLAHLMQRTTEAFVALSSRYVQDLSGELTRRASELATRRSTAEELQRFTNALLDLRLALQSLSKAHSRPGTPSAPLRYECAQAISHADSLSALVTNMAVIEIQRDNAQATQAAQALARTEEAVQRRFATFGAIFIAPALLFAFFGGSMLPEITSEPGYPSVTATIAVVLLGVVASGLSLGVLTLVNRFRRTRNE